MRLWISIGRFSERRISQIFVHTRISYLKSKGMLAQPVGRGQLHSEVMKRLLSMKSDKNIRNSVLVEDSDEIDESEAVLKSMGSDSIGMEVSGFEFKDIAPEFMMQKMIQIISRNHMLEAALKQSESKAQRLEARNKQLEAELVRKETMRLSQLELLSLRNVELEMQLHTAGVKPTHERPPPPHAAAWASWNGKNFRQAPARGLRSPAASDALLPRKHRAPHSPPPAAEGPLFH